MSEQITAREFLNETFELGFLLTTEIETIITAMELYAKVKCIEQRKICAAFFEKLKRDDGVAMSDAEFFFIACEEPTFELDPIKN